MHTIWQDLRLAARLLRSKPAFTIVAILTLGLGIGANTAIFSVVHAVVLNPLPFPDPERIVLVRDDLTGRQLEDVGMSVDELNDLQQRAGIFSELSAVWPVDANLTGTDRPERIELLAVSPNYFALLGAQPQLGRVFGPQEVTAGFAEGVVISDGLWHRLFNADPHVLGRSIYADTDRYTVVGVMPAGFRHPAKTLRNDVEMWAAAGFAANPFSSPPVRASRMLPGAIGRLKPGVDRTQAQAKVDALVANLRGEFPNEYPAAAGWAVKLLPARDALVGNVQATLFILLGAVALVLLIACANIANLLLAKASGRRREMALRLALGAGRGRLIAQLLTESVLVALVGGAVALVVVALTMRVLLPLLPPDIPRLNEIRLDRAVLGFVCLISTVTGLLFGLVPALQTSRPDLAADMRDGTLGAGADRRHHRFRGGLVVAEFALSLVLMIAAGLLLRSFGRLLDVNPGFDPHHVLLARIWLPVPNDPTKDVYRDPIKKVTFMKRVIAGISAVPGVKHAAVGNGNGVPMLPPHGTILFTIEGQASPDTNLPAAQPAVVSPDYFRALGTPLVGGRFFTDTDEVGQPPVLVVDAAFARRYFPGQDPVGRHIRRGGNTSKAPWSTIVGVVGTIKTDGFDERDQPHLYLPLYQSPGYSMAVYVRTESSANIANAVRDQIRAVDPTLPVFGERTMEDVVGDSLARRRFTMEVLGLFGALALLLAGIGIYGVMAYSVSQRTREIGIRVALGASRGTILRDVLRQGLVLVALGMAAGLLSAFVLMRLLRTLLFDVAPTDLATYGGLAVLLGVVALAACYIPALRATRVDPLVALRYE